MNHLRNLFKNLTSKKALTVTRMFLAALFAIAKNWKQPKCPLIGECINNSWFMYLMEYHTGENERITATYNIDES